MGGSQDVGRLQLLAARPRRIGMDLSRRLYRSRTERIVAGVAGGMAQYLGVDPTLVRLLWVLALLPGGVPGLLLYLLCWLIIPREPGNPSRRFPAQR
jgi:phage shock protein PspC (stress-responsive transcriptional regulator)